MRLAQDGPEARAEPVAAAVAAEQEQQAVQPVQQRVQAVVQPVAAVQAVRSSAAVRRAAGNSAAHAVVELAAAVLPPVRALVC